MPNWDMTAWEASKEESMGMQKWEKDLLLEDIRLYGQFVAGIHIALNMIGRKDFEDMGDVYEVVAGENARLATHCFNRIKRTLQGGDSD